MTVEQGIETTTVPAQSDQRMCSHIVCAACYPEDPTPMGTPAICGEKVLGIPATGSSNRCPKCETGREKHVRDYHMNWTNR